MPRDGCVLLGADPTLPADSGVVKVGSESEWMDEYEGGGSEAQVACPEME